MEDPDLQQQQISEQPETVQQLPFQEKGGGKEPEIDMQVCSTSLKPVAQAMPFKAGRIHGFIDEWKFITSDAKILDIVNGCKIEFNTCRSPLSIKGTQTS